MRGLLLVLKAVLRLGARPVFLNARYRLGLWTGYYRCLRADQVRRVWSPQPLRSLFALPRREELEAVLGEEERATLLAEADEIVAGRVRLFGVLPFALRFAPGSEVRGHWSDYERGKERLPFSSFPDLPAPDVKFLWEPARFGWVFSLGRAYRLTGEEHYAEAFWRYAEEFFAAHPPYLGWQWMNGQEVALRLMALVWAGQVFADSTASTPERQARLAEAVALHAARIPPTLVYARSQNNNHLLSEAAALFTAGLALPSHPYAARWRALGWKWFHAGLQAQIDSYGEYSQHSTNYHRLMLQLALWMYAVSKRAGFPWPVESRAAVRRAVHWLLALLDADTGRVPNLGANDGAYIFPLTICPFADFRPVAFAAARAFLRYTLPAGPWDEMAFWFDGRDGGSGSLSLPRYVGDQIYGRESWACLRVAQFHSRPSHADQLHLDLWWRGLNLAQDAGTYLYNAPPPWDNSLTSADVHNTVTLDGRDHFTRAGLFLYLDWFPAYRRNVLTDDPNVLQQVRGWYRNYRQRYRHTRTVTAWADGRWWVEDELLPLSWFSPGRVCAFRLHWLFPDYPWEMEEEERGVLLSLETPIGMVRIRCRCLQPEGASWRVSLARAGTLLVGRDEVEARRGWVSPTYGVRIPALSLAFWAESQGVTTLLTEFLF